MTDSAGGGASALGELLREAGPVEFATAAVTLAVLVLGLYVGYQSYRGYRRNDSRPVLFLGIGVALVATGRPVVSTLGYLLLPGADLVLAVVSFGVSVTGLLSILYAFSRA
ncbi:hypothetical protein SY89_00822 [Halolamina pelagica]|uniref:Uncharacterized protein n=1 Tax=Halolamina pelagica TaxID=699431 RepID=A0A0P7GNA8_9EURY|nr:hypothetical protein [Halolamina pelagica]KPN30100.1 hypothetical protein SY89_00822 [Halolamina pelagica]